MNYASNNNGDRLPGEALPPVYSDVFSTSQAPPPAYSNTPPAPGYPNPPPSFTQSQIDKNNSTFSTQIPPGQYPAQYGVQPTPYGVQQPPYSQMCYMPYPISSQPYPTTIPGCEGVPQAVAVMTTFRSSRQMRITCGHCRNDMMFFGSGVARCPTCHRISSIGSSNARRRAFMFVVFGVLCLILAIGATVASVLTGICHSSLCIGWSGAYIIGICFIAYALRYFVMTKSFPARSE